MKHDLVGKKFGRLVVLKKNGYHGKCIKWLCKCDCGTEKDFLTHHLTQKIDSSKSCGCLKKELLQPNFMECKICKETKNISEFYKKEKRINTRHRICIECYKKDAKIKCRERLVNLRMGALNAYSNNNPQCSCCGTKHIEFLAIDHINGGGNKHRKKIGSGSGTLYRWLKRNNYPDGFRILCNNCNYSYGIYGYCPHGDK